jgi:hypothetical protein
MMDASLQAFCSKTLNLLYLGGTKTSVLVKLAGKSFTCVDLKLEMLNGYLISLSETIVVNVYRDRKLRAWITKALEYAKVYEDSKLVESLLAMIHRGMGDYGLPRGATSSQADASLFDQMKRH